MSLASLDYVGQIDNSPEGVLTGAPGALVVDRIGGVAYLKESARLLNTGWQRLITGKQGYYSVKWAGAAGDGATDDTAAFRAGMLAASTLNIPLLVPSGTYLITAQLDIPSDLVMFGEYDSVVKASGSFELFFNINTKSNIRLEGFTLDGGSAAATCGVYVVVSSQVHIEKMIIRNFTRARDLYRTSGVMFDRASHCKVLNNYFLNNGRDDEGASTVDNATIMFRSHATIDSTYIEIRGNRIVNAGLWAIGGHDFSHCTIADNYIDQGDIGTSSWNDGYGILCYASDHRGATVSSIDTATEIITFTAAHGMSTGDEVYINGVTQPRGTVRYKPYYFRSESSTTGKLYDTAANAATGGATGLLNFDSAGASVGVTHAWHRCIGNRFVNNQIRNCWGMGIYVVCGRDNLIQGNDIESSCLSMEGTSLIVAAINSNTSLRTRIVNNTIRDCGVAQPPTTTVAGIAIVAANGDSASGNTIENVYGFGIWNGGGTGDGMPCSAYVTISGNPLITRTELDGIRVAYISNEATISQNTVSGVSGHGIRLLALNRSQVLGNTVMNWGSGNHGILLESGAATAVRNLIANNNVIVNGESVYGSGSAGIYVTTTSNVVQNNYVFAVNTLAFGYRDTGGQNTWTDNVWNNNITTPYSVTGTSSFFKYSGSGAPGLIAAVGSIYHRTDGGAGTSLYVKEADPTAATGWVGK